MARCCEAKSIMLFILPVGPVLLLLQVFSQLLRAPPAEEGLGTFSHLEKKFKKLYLNRVGIIFGFSHLVHVLDGLDQRRA